MCMHNILSYKNFTLIYLPIIIFSLFSLIFFCFAFHFTKWKIFFHALFGENLKKIFLHKKKNKQTSKQTQKFSSYHQQKHTKKQPHFQY